MATLLYTDPASISRFTEILLPDNRSITLEVGVPTEISDELAAIIPHNIPRLSVFDSSGSPAGQTAQAVIKALPVFDSSVAEAQDSAAKAEAQDSVAKAEAGAKGGGKKTTNLLEPDFLNPESPVEAGL